ncbi:MAG: penicillin acylase family protein [Proteobacteria bacterium]|nr:penicillin acylase family protein [Pseudomonadota bacterium]
MKRIGKILVGIVVLMLIVLLGIWLYLRGSLPKTSGTIELKGIQANVEIIRDADGIPHIFAMNDQDAAFAQGYVHAQDRMWQMEFQRRAGAGRLSEILGKTTLESDKFLRTMGFYRSAINDYPGLNEMSKQAIEAYVAGVNAWIDEGHMLPVEFRILGHKPEPWTVFDSLVWSKLMDLDLGGNYKSELRRIRLIRLLGKERAADLTPEYPEDGISIIPPEELPIKALDDLLSFHGRLEKTIKTGGVHIGSNNWVVSGEHTATGKPILANDPHLGAGIPSVWYLNEIKGDKIHVVGASFVGLPGVIIGHNQHIAWGVTNFGPDVQDLFIEKINPANPNQYEVDGKWVDMEIIEEPIYIKGVEKPILWAARSTRHGPMISDVVKSADLPLSLRWTALDGGDTTYNAFLGIDYAKNWQDFEKALRDYVAPVQNFVFADQEGNIGYIGYGKIPIRKKGDGLLPVPGWNSEYEWTSYIPFDELPRVLNPKQGFIVTANNRVVPEEYPYLLTKEWAAPYRAQRITDMINDLKTRGVKITLEEMAKIQGDQISLQSLELVGHLLKISPANEKQKMALSFFQDWDGSTARTSVATSIYQSWVNHLGNYVVKDDIQGDQKNDLYKHFSNSRMSIFLAEVLGKEDSLWCDNVLSTRKETCRESASLALDDAIEELEELLGEEMSDWQWGKIHRTQFPHKPFSQVPYLKTFFHREIENGGARSTVNPSSPNYAKGYKNFHIPSVRFLIDMNEVNKSKFILPPGQSGNFMSSHYDDLMERHNKVEYLNMTFGKDNTSGDVLILKPAD